MFKSIFILTIVLLTIVLFIDEFQIRLLKDKKTDFLIPEFDYQFFNIN